MAKIGLIDLGSNTIRLVIYQTQGEKFEEKFNTRYFTGIISYIVKDELTEEGLITLIDCLKELKKVSYQMNCRNIHCFSTASLRSVTNFQEINDKIIEETGLNIDCLGKEEEIEYDFRGLEDSIRDENGFAFDLGGGSVQLFTFENKCIKQSCSQMLGSLYLYNKFVKNIVPSQEERKEIKKYVVDTLTSIDLDVTTNKVYAIGGTARALIKVYQCIFKEDLQMKITDIQVSKLLKELKSDDEKTIKRLSEIVPQRLFTFIPGLIVIKQILKLFKITEICVVESGVREGYLCKKLLLPQQIEK